MLQLLQGGLVTLKGGLDDVGSLTLALSQLLELLRISLLLLQQLLVFHRCLLGLLHELMDELFALCELSGKRLRIRKEIHMLRVLLFPHHLTVLACSTYHPVTLETVETGSLLYSMARTRSLKCPDNSPHPR